MNKYEEVKSRMSATQCLAKTNTFFYSDSATGKHQNLSLGPNHYLEVLLPGSRRDGPRWALTATPWPGEAGPAHSHPPPPRPSSQARSCISPHSSGPHHLLPCLLFLACSTAAPPHGVSPSPLPPFPAFLRLLDPASPAGQAPPVGLAGAEGPLEVTQHPRAQRPDPALPQACRPSPASAQGTKGTEATRG